MSRITAAMAAAGRTLAEPRLSPSGDRVAFLSTSDGAARIVVVDLGTGPPDRGTGPEVVITTAPAPVPSQAYGGGAFDWLPDGSGVVYAAVDGGLWRQAASGGPPVQLTTGGGPVSAPAVSPDGTRVAYVIDTRDVCVTSLDPGGRWPVRLTSDADFALDPTWSPDGLMVAWHTWDVPAMPWDESRIVVRDAEAVTEAKVLGGGPDVSVSQPRYSPDGSIGFIDDASGWSNVVAGDVRIGEPVEHGGPTWGPGDRSWCWSPDGASVAYTRNEDGWGSLHVRDLQTGEDRRLGRAVHGALSWRGDRIAAIRSGGVTPTAVVVYDRCSSADPDRRVVARGPVAGFEGVVEEPEVVRWTAMDGAVIPGRLYRPRFAAAVDLLGARGADRSVEHRVPRAVRVLDRPWLGCPGARPPRVDRSWPRVPAGAARPVGRDRRRRLRRGPPRRV